MKDKDDLLSDDEFEDRIKIERKGPFYFHSKTIFLTYPQCNIDEKIFFNLFKSKMEEVDCNIILGLCCLENHKNTEGFHIHLYCEFEKKIQTRNERFFDILYDDIIYHPNIQRPYNRVGIIKYISGLTKKKKKDKKNVYEYKINVTKYLKNIKKKKNIIFDELINKKINLIQAIDIKPDLIKIYKVLKTNLNLYWSDKSDKDFDKRKCFWIYGPPGIGKSFSIRNVHPDLYMKNSTKWWDGYVDQKVVLIDDFDNSCLGHYIKIWADNYLFIGEVKGGTVVCKYSILYVTSNYTIENIFLKENDELSKLLVDAIKRRFIFINALDYIKNNYFYLDNKFN